jgi:uncharacterized membrane protein required for colicin V production
MNWVDLFIVLTLAAAFWGGYRNGIVREALLSVCLLIAWLVAGSLSGAASTLLQRSFHLAPASAHLATFWALFLAVFCVVRISGWAADRPLAGSRWSLLSRVGGGLVGCGEAVLALWLILFVGLFFPLAPDVHATLHASPSVRWIESIDQPVYGSIVGALPENLKPVGRFILTRHHL